MGLTSNFRMESLPVCAVCRKPVNSIEYENTLDGDVVFRVECHGQTEVTKLSRNQLSLMTGLQPDVAFKTQRVSDSEDSAGVGGTLGTTCP